MRFACVVTVFTAAHGIQFQASVGPGKCDEEEMAQVRRLIGSGKYSEIASSPCIPVERLAAAEAGEEDLADAWEYLGCEVDGDFYHPGPCGQQLPASGCSKTQLPSFLYLGLPHCASTSIAYELNTHPNLSFGSVKEHNFFTSPDPDKWKTPYLPDRENCSQTARQQLSTCRTGETYQNEFLVDCEVQHTFDATPSNFFLSYGGTCSEENFLDCPINYHWRKPGENALRTLRDMLGADLRLVSMFRDPIDAIQSRCGSKGLANCKTGLHRNVGWCYADYLEPWLRVFPRENFLFLDFDEFTANPQSVLDQIYDFLSVERKPVSSITTSLGRRRNSYDVLSDDFRKDYYSEPGHKSCKERLEALTGMHLNWKMSSP